MPSTPLFFWRSRGRRSVSGSTDYHLIAQGSWTVSATNYVGWRMDGSAGAYPQHKALWDSDTTTWTADADDCMIFGIGLEYDNTAVTLQTDYTKKCFLGWVYNDTSSNFVPFIQVNRSSRYTVLDSTIGLVVSLGGDAELVDIVSYLPPRDILRVRFAITGTGTGGGIAAIGDLTATDILSTGSTTGAQVVMYSAVTTQTPSAFAEVCSPSWIPTRGRSCLSRMTVIWSMRSPPRSGRSIPTNRR